MSYIQSLNFSKKWEFEKMQHFNSELDQVTLTPGEILYDLGSATEVFYLVMTGKLVIEAEVSIVEVNQYPVSLDRWEVITTERVFEYKAH